MPVVTLHCGTVTQYVGSTPLGVSDQQGTGAIWSDGDDDTFVRFGPQYAAQLRVVRYLAPLDAVPVAAEDTLNSLTLRLRGWWDNGNTQPHVQAYLDEASAQGRPANKQNDFPPTTVGPRLYWKPITLAGVGWAVDEDGIYQGLPGWTTHTATYPNADLFGGVWSADSIKDLLRQDTPTVPGASANSLVIEMWTSNNNEGQTCRIIEAEVLVDYTIGDAPPASATGRMPAMRQVQRSDGLGAGGPPRAVQTATMQSSLRRGPDGFV